MPRDIDRGDKPIEANLRRTYRCGAVTPDQFSQLLDKLRDTLERRLDETAAPTSH